MFKNITRIETINDRYYLVNMRCDFDVDSIIYFKSGWGNEYRKTTERFGREFSIEEVKGRSSASYHPYIIVKDEWGNYHYFAIGYSGNWKFEIIKSTRNIHIRIGLGDAVKINEALFLPKVMYKESKQENKSFRELLSNQEVHSELSNFPLTWNHWWSYEDQKINEEVFLSNSKLAKYIGCDYVVLDAGWFGDSHNWMEIRGDWEKENLDKFPNGILYLSEQVNQMGLKFGIWLEIEALGKLASNYKKLEKYLAIDLKGKRSDLLCFGNQEVIEYILHQVKKVIDKYHVKWLKLDFNIDPAFGCRDKKHQHGEKDGLQAHITGLYTVIKEIKKEYPEVILENCSSGGLRSDYQIMRLFDVNFLSDADYMEHKTRCFKHSNHFYPNQKNYHFLPSMTLTEFDSGFRSTSFENLSGEEIHYYLNTSLFGITGLSHRLIDYPEKTIEQIKIYYQVYKSTVVEFMRNDNAKLDFNSDYAMISYKKAGEQLIGICAHRPTKLQLPRNSVDLFSGKELPEFVELRAKTGLLLKSKNEQHNR